LVFLSLKNILIKDIFLRIVNIGEYSVLIVYKIYLKTATYIMIFNWVLQD